MQVKCYKTAIRSGCTYNLDRLSNLIDREGTCLLGQWKNGGDDVQVRSNNTDTESLFILGGRGSITHWLRLQGSAPRVGNPHGSIWATHMRRKRTFSKDQTMVAISGDQYPFLDRDHWQVSFPHKLDDFFLHLSANERSMGSYTPEMLAGLFDQFFART